MNSCVSTRSDPAGSDEESPPVTDELRRRENYKHNTQQGNSLETQPPTASGEVEALTQELMRVVDVYAHSGYEPDQCGYAH